MRNIIRTVIVAVIAFIMLLLSGCGDGASIDRKVSFEDLKGIWYFEDAHDGNKELAISAKGTFEYSADGKSVEVGEIAFNTGNRNMIFDYLIHGSHALKDNIINGEYKVMEVKLKKLIENGAEWDTGKLKKYEDSISKKMKKIYQSIADEGRSWKVHGIDSDGEKLSFREVFDDGTLGSVSHVDRREAHLRSISD